MTGNLQVVLGLLGLSLIGVAIFGDPIYYRLTYFWVLLLSANWIWSRLALRKLKIERASYMRRGQIGQIFEERFDLENNSRIPRLWVEVKDISKLPGSPGSRIHSMIGRRQGRSYLGRTRLVQRGAYDLGPTELHAGDPFGFFPVSKTFPIRDSLLVYPMIVEVETFPGPPGLLPGGEALNRRTHQITPNAATIREYYPGDSISRIDWKSTARRDKLMVKEFELDPLAEVWVFVDAQEDAHSRIPYTPVTDVEGALFQLKEDPKLAPATEEYAATAAASIARFYLRRGRAVGLLLSGTSTEVLPPDRGGRQFDKILEALAMLKVEGQLPFPGVIASQCRYLPRGSTVVLVTPTVEKDLSIVVDQLIRLGLRPVVILINADSFKGAPGTNELAVEIQTLGVCVAALSNGDNVGTALSLAGSRAGELALMPARTNEIL